MKEEWRWIEEAPAYKVSSWGNIKSFLTEKENYIKPSPQKEGYLKVLINNKDRKVITRQIHRLVAQTFLPSPAKQRIFVNHKDYDRKNNRVENLEWCTAKENTLHSMKRRGISRSIVQLTLEGKIVRHWDTVTEAADYLKIYPSSISHFLTRKEGPVRQGCAGFLWVYTTL